MRRCRAPLTRANLGEPLVRTRSDNHGFFSVDVPSGRYTVFVDRRGLLGPVGYSHCTYNPVDAYGDFVHVRGLEIWDFRR